MGQQEIPNSSAGLRGFEGIEDAVHFIATCLALKDDRAGLLRNAPSNIKFQSLIWRETP